MGLVMGPHTRTPRPPQPVGSGPRQPAQRAGSRGWVSARLRTPHTQAGGAPPQGPSCRPHSAQNLLKRARAVGLVTGSHARTAPHPQPVGSGPRQPAQRAGSRGWESARPRTPHTQARGAPPRAPSCRPHSAQSQLARARAVGLVTGSHARTAPLPQPVGSGPRQPAQRAGSRGWESARPRTPHTQAGGAPARAPSCRPHSAQGLLKRARAVGLVTGSHARTAPLPQPVGSGPRQPAQRAGSRGCESARPRTPHTKARGAPARAPSCRPHSAQSQLARARVVGLVTGLHARIPPHQQPVGSGPRQPAQRAGSRGCESARTRTPHTQARGAPPGTLMPPPQRAKPARKSARCWPFDRSPRPQPPAPTASG